MIRGMLVLSALISIGTVALAGTDDTPGLLRGPEAGGRTYAVNYKDMVLARCLAKAYEGVPDTAKDVGSSANALRDWTYYDMNAATGEVDTLIKDYLARDYTNPLAESEAKGVRFDLLKCLDLYHSPALKAQVERFVEQPDRTWQQDQGR